MIRTEVEPTQVLLDFLTDLKEENKDCYIYVTENELNIPQGVKVVDWFIADNGTQEVHITVIKA